MAAAGGVRRGEPPMAAVVGGWTRVVRGRRDAAELLEVSPWAVPPSAEGKLWRRGLGPRCPWQGLAPHVRVQELVTASVYCPTVGLGRVAAPTRSSLRGSTRLGGWAPWQPPPLVHAAR